MKNRIYIITVSLIICECLIGKANACNMNDANFSTVKTDSISPADRKYYEPVGKSGTIGAFFVDGNEAINEIDSMDNTVYHVIETQPQFPGGTNGLMSWLSHNINYPEKAYKENIQGQVIVQFVIDLDGHVTDVKVVRGVDPSLDAEAIRVIKSMPLWLPAIQDGKPVKVRFTLPISFKR